MSLQPQLRRVLIPPGDPLDFKTASPVEQRTALYQGEPQRKPIQAHSPCVKYSTIHPVHPWIAYVRDDKWLIVQNTQTREIIYDIHWYNVAAAVYGEQETKKLPAAAKSLGTIQSLKFYDVATLFWSRLLWGEDGGGTAEQPQPQHRPYPRWHSLAVQTERRVILLNLRRGAKSVVAASEPLAAPKKSSYRIILAHLNEKTVNSVPSSNILPLTDRWLLVGCFDGSMKCYDWTVNTTVKKIKGLGKGDYVVQLLPANTYVTGVSSSTTSTKRILTMTKKGTVFLIEIKIVQNETSLEILPPMARFATTTDHHHDPMTMAEMEHCIYSFDAHNDRFHWYVPTKREPKLYVWDLRQCLIGLSNTTTTNATASPPPTIPKPDPTLVIQFPAVSTCIVPTATGFGSLLPWIDPRGIWCRRYGRGGDSHRYR
jgi:hypothetical protein